MNRYHRWERRTTPWLTGLALLALVNFVLASALGRRLAFTDPVDYVAWAVFAVDYGVRLYLVQDRWRFVRTHPLDLIAVAVPAIRSLRVLAVFSRVAIVAQRGRSKRLLITTTFVALTVVLVAGGAVLNAERGARQRLGGHHDELEAEARTHPGCVLGPQAGHPDALYPQRRPQRRPLPRLLPRGMAEARG